MVWVITAWGHPKITATHPTTFMVTTDPEITPKGNCVIGVRSDMSASTLPSELRDVLRSGEELLITLEVGNKIEKVRARGHPSLVLDHPTDLVVRKSNFVCGRTLAINADKSAADLSRSLITALHRPEARLRIRIETT